MFRPRQKTYPRQLWEHLDLYYRTAGLGSNTIINLPPDSRGLIPDDIAAAAKTLGDDIRRRLSHPVAELKEVTPGDVVELSWKSPAEINTVVTMENIANGQKVAKYALEAMVDGKWQALEPRNRLVAGNVFTKGAQASRFDRDALVTPDFDPAASLVEKADGWYLTLATDPAWAVRQKRVPVTTAVLGKAKLSDQEFTHPDGSPVRIDTDYLGVPRHPENPFPGPFEKAASEVKGWPKGSR